MMKAKEKFSTLKLKSKAVIPGKTYVTFKRRFIFMFNYVYVCRVGGAVHVSADTYRVQKRLLDPL